MGQVEFVKFSSYIVNMTIYHKCEGGIEKSVQRIVVWHHEAFRVLTDGLENVCHRKVEIRIC